MRTSAARNLPDHVVQQLGRQIVDGRLRPGAALPREEALAQDMAVSRTVLREGLKLLAAKGLIESRQKTGTRVRDSRHWNQLDPDVLAWRCAAMPTADFVEKLVEMRAIIEPAAAAAAARRRDAMQLAQLKAAYQAMADAADLDAWARADLEFHQRVLEAANNELMTSLFAVIDTALAAYFRLSARSAVDFKYSLPQHFAVYDAIRRRRANAAGAAMLALVEDSRGNLRRRFRDGKAR
ncbi:FadR/GntR family transcriptional regulator [Pseudoxanthomonas sangjuensis]